MSCKEVVTFWLDTGAPISLLFAEADCNCGPQTFARTVKSAQSRCLDQRFAGHDGSMDVTAIAALAFTIAAVGVIAFQIALALGAPWGRYAMGGAFPGRFPPRMRVAAVTQAILIALLAVAVLSAAGLVLPELALRFPWLIWVVVVISAVAAILNAISRSAGERRIWVPVASVMLVSSLLVALDL
jgi:hypothetical protein